MTNPRLPEYCTHRTRFLAVLGGSTGANAATYVGVQEQYTVHWGYVNLGSDSKKLFLLYHDVLLHNSRTELSLSGGAARPGRPCASVLLGRVHVAATMSGESLNPKP